MDLTQYVGKYVRVVIYRKHKYRVHYGRLTDIGSTEICLADNGRSRWIRKPYRYKDSISEVNQADKQR